MLRISYSGAFCVHYMPVFHKNKSGEAGIVSFASTDMPINQILYQQLFQKNQMAQPVRK
jgi:hypothetical protein